MKAFVVSILAIALNLGAEEAKTPAKAVPARFCIPLRLIPPLDINPTPSEKNAVTIGSIQADHFILHDRRYDLWKCEELEQTGVKTIELVGKPDATGACMLRIIYADDPDKPAKHAALVIVWLPAGNGEIKRSPHIILLP